MNRVHRLRPLHLLTAVSLLVTLLLVAPPPLAEADTGELTWSAQDASGAAVTGTFEVTGPDGETRTVVDNGAEDADPRAGVVTLTDQPRGDYEIAPQVANGQVTSPEVLEVSLTESGQTSADESVFVYEDETPQPQAPEATQRPKVEKSPEAEQPNPAETSAPEASGSESASPSAEPTPTAGAREAIATAQALEDEGLVAPMAAVDTMDIRINKRVFANPSSATGSVSSNIGTNYDLTQGAVFRLHANNNGSIGAPISASWATCQVAVNGTCTIEVPGANVFPPQGNRGVRYWVVEMDPVAGSPAASTYSNPTLYLGAYTGPKKVRRLVGLTTAVEGNTTITMPMTANNISGGTPITTNELPNTPRPTVAEAGSFGAVATSHKNPPIQPRCTVEAPPRIAIVVDQSASIGTNQWKQMRTAIVGGGGNSVLGILQDKASVAIVGFGSTTTNADWHTGPAPVAVTAQSRDSIAGNFPNTRPGGGTNATNWHSAMQAVQNNLAQNYDLVLFVTDGAPNFILNQQRPSGYDVTLRSLEAPIYAANAIKASGTRIVAVGVGNGASGSEVAANLRAVSGEVSGSDYIQGDWDQLNDILADIAKAATCTLPIEVSKTTVNNNGVTTQYVAGWEFTATKSGDGALSSPASKTTGPGVNNTAKWDLNFTQPTGQTASVTISETPRANWDLTNVVCTVAGVNYPVTVSDGAVTISGLSTNSEKVSCVFTNGQRGIARWVKENEAGEKLGGSEWSLVGPAGAFSTARPITDCVAASAANCTGLDKNPAVGEFEVRELPYGDYTLVETVAPTGYELDTTERTETMVNGVVNFQVILNKRVPAASVTSKKIVQDVNGENPTPTSGWTMGAELHGTPATGTTITPTSTQMTAGTGGVTPAWTINFPNASGSADVRVWEVAQSGYDFVSGTCILTPETGTPRTVHFTDDAEKVLTGTNVVKPGDTVECEFINQQQPGSATWQKIDSVDAAKFLPGSEWTIDGPGFDEVVIEDCVAVDAAECTGLDQDPAGGKFQLENLKWGDYTVTETKAPPGYVLNDPAHSFSFVISGASLIHEGEAYQNHQPTGPDLPMTGGLGREHILMAGAVLLLLALTGYGVNRRRIRGSREAA